MLKNPVDWNGGDVAIWLSSMAFSPSIIQVLQGGRVQFPEPGEATDMTRRERNGRSRITSYRALDAAASSYLRECRDN